MNKPTLWPIGGKAWTRRLNGQPVYLSGNALGDAVEVKVDSTVYITMDKADWDKLPQAY